MDAGPDFYAPQVVVGTVDEPRTLMWGWSWEKSRNDADILASGWAGVLTYARVLSFSDGQLRSEPVAEVDSLRNGVISADTGSFTVPRSTRAFDVTADSAVELVLVDGEQERVVAAIAAGRILVDGSLVEVFADGDTPTQCGCIPRRPHTSNSGVQLPSTGWPSSRTAHQLHGTPTARTPFGVRAVGVP
ncbi:hypothetical protein NHF46_22955 [Arthrobacter alpinus]|nr:hypothetical protein [Arthrobacter alpinus]